MSNKLSSKSLAVKYRPKTFEDVVEQSVVTDILKNIATNSDNLTLRNFLLIGSAGTGKAQPLYSKVLTPDGFINMGDVELGTKVVTASGNLGSVSQIFPQGKRDIYEITLDDDSTIRVADNHLNLVWLYIGDPDPWVLETTSLIDLFSKPATNVFYIYSIVGNKKAWRKIVDIKYIGKEECQCIMIDHPDHTYISDNFIPTHNTTCARILANELNHGEGEPIEIDAASNNGVDAMRGIVDQAKTYPIVGKYKVFIIDECFHKNTLVDTPLGKRRISDIKQNDLVYNMTGTASVSKVLKNKVKTDNLVLVYVNGSSILTTKDHLFFTSDGWVKAKDLVKGDVLYDNKTMRSLRQNVSVIPERQSQSLQQGMRGSSTKEKSSEGSFREAENRVHKSVSDLWKGLLHSSVSEFDNLFKEMFLYLQKATRDFKETDRLICFAQAGIYLSCLREAYENPEERSSEILFSRMFGEISSYSRITPRYPTTCEVLCDMWKYVYPEIQGSADLFKELQIYSNCFQNTRKKESRSVRTDEGTQSDGKSRNFCEDESNQDEEWNMVKALCAAWRKWTFYQAADTSSSSIRGWMGLRTSSENTYFKTERDALSCELQTRPCIAGKEAWSRSGWEKPQYEISTVIRSEESNLFGELRVDGVEVFKRGDNEQHFERYFSNSELCSETVDMYDLQIAGHPSYFVEGVLVHNCHALSNSSWQALLKVLEEAPAASVFMLATTNPEKIPETILSRVMTFQLSKISLSGIFNRLKYVLDKEIESGRNIKYEENAVNFIAKLGNGGMRDSLTLLDTALSYSNNITMENVEKSLNLPNYNDYFSLLQSIAKKDNKSIIETISSVYNSGVNFVKWFEGFHSFVINIVKYINIQDINMTMIPSTYLDKISKYGPAHCTICLKLSNILVKLIHELKSTNYQQEMAITYLCSAKKG